MRENIAVQQMRQHPLYQVMTRRIGSYHMDIVPHNYASNNPCYKCGKGERHQSSSYCRECLLANRKGYYKKNYKPGQNKDYILRSRFNLTQKQYDAMLKRQKGVCAICREPETDIDHRTGKVRALAVDHNHATGANRALLCRKCNWIVGLVENDARYRKAAAYIKMHEKGNLRRKDILQMYLDEF